MEMIRKRIVFHGRVQGVGFRYTARMYAAQLGLTGWVQNDWEGTVTMEVQGAEGYIQSLLQLLQGGRFIHISKMDTEVIPVVTSESGFGVKR